MQLYRKTLEDPQYGLARAFQFFKRDDRQPALKWIRLETSQDRVSRAAPQKKRSKRNERLPVYPDLEGIHLTAGLLLAGPKTRSITRLDGRAQANKKVLGVAHHADKDRHIGRLGERAGRNNRTPGANRNLFTI